MRGALRRPAGIEPAVGLVIVVFALLAPVILSQYWIAALLTEMLIFGICAASLIFLSAYGGMVSLAQLALYGIAGFALGNFTTTGNTKGLNLGWAIGPGVVVALAAAVLFAVLFGALANRSYGIYFLMITLVFSVITNLVFGQVTSISGFGGISGIRAPNWIDPNAHASRLYWVTLLIALAVLVGLRYLARTPFGVALQGIRDDPQRMRTLGYRVALHRTVAFAIAGFVAGVGGILYVWWNGQISPSTIGLPNVINILVIAVIGGLYRVEAAWLGAFVFVVLNNYAESISFVGARFNTWIGIVFLVIVVVSPNGLIGLWEQGLRRWTGRSGAQGDQAGTGDHVPQVEPTGS